MVFDKKVNKFLNLLALENNVEIPSSFYNVANQYLKQIVKADKGFFVKRNNLFSLLLIQPNEIKDFKTYFYSTMKKEVFKKQINQMNIYSTNKDLMEEKKNQNLLTKKDQDKAKVFIDKITNQINLFETKQNECKQNQSKNEKINKVINDFYHVISEQIVNQLKWQLYGFQVIKNCKLNEE